MAPRTRAATQSGYPGVPSPHPMAAPPMAAPPLPPPPPRVTVDSIAAAIQAFMDAPTAPRSALVSSVTVAHSASLLAFLEWQEDHHLWEIVNAAPLHELVTIDRLLRAIAIDVLPVLVADPTSPTRSVLSRYAVYVHRSAPAVGGDFEDSATAICNDLIGYADSTSRRRRVRLSAADLLRRLTEFRSQRFTIAGTNHVDPNLLPGTMGFEHIQANSFRRLASLREEVFFHGPPVERRVIIGALPSSHSSALLGVLSFEGSASDWGVHNFRRLIALADADVSLELVDLGVLPFLRDNPCSEPARHFLLEYVRGIREKLGEAGGEFLVHGINLCDDIIAQGTRPLPAPEMKLVAEKLRGDLHLFRCRDLFIQDSDTTDSSASSGSDVDDSGSSASDDSPGSSSGSDSDAHDSGSSGSDA